MNIHVKTIRRMGPVLVLLFGINILAFLAYFLMTGGVSGVGMAPFLIFMGIADAAFIVWQFLRVRKLPDRPRNASSMDDAREVKRQERRAKRKQEKKRRHK